MQRGLVIRLRTSSSDYARRYFDFVLDAPGEVLFATANSHETNPQAAAQIVAEQWLLTAVAHYWNNVKLTPLKTRAVCKAIWTHGLYSAPFDESEAVAAEVTSTCYHLWGAKAVQKFKIRAEHQYVRDVLIGGRRIAERSTRFGPVRDLIETLTADLLRDVNPVRPRHPQLTM